MVKRLTHSITLDDPFVEMVLPTEIARLKTDNFSESYLGVFSSLAKDLTGFSKCWLVAVTLLNNPYFMDKSFRNGTITGKNLTGLQGAWITKH